MLILVNQVGSESGSPVRAVMQGRSGETLPDTAVLRSTEGRRIADVPAGNLCIVPGWKDRVFRILEFRVPDGGPWVLEAEGDQGPVVSASFRCGRFLEASSLVSDLLSGFTAARSSGTNDRADRTVSFFGDRDGTVDVHGGWYDASGDTSKYLSHLSYANFMNPQQTPLVVWTILDALDRMKTGPFPLGERLELRLKEEATWGADFLVRMQDSEGYFYTTVFDGWTKDLDARKICGYRTQAGVLSDDYQAGYRQGGGLAVAALARASRLEGTGFGDYPPKRYREAAFSGWRHLESHSTQYLDDGRENIIDDFCALMAASELFAAGIGEARNAAEKRARSLVDRWDEDRGCFRADDEGAWSWFHASDEGLPLLALMRSVETGAVARDAADIVWTTISKALRAELDRCESPANPFLHPRRHIRMPGREAADRFFYPHDNPSGYWWQGENARLASLAAAVRRFMSDTGGLAGPAAAELERFADAQVSWILGLNPFDSCMMHGKGRNNPAYEWDHFNLPGGVANGITAGFEDEDDIAFIPEDLPDAGDHSWRWGEQWIPHAAWLLLAAAWSGPRE